jgi:hypothetical protein
MIPLQQIQARNSESEKKQPKQKRVGAAFRREILVQRETTLMLGMKVGVQMRWVEL